MRRTHKLMTLFALILSCSGSLGHSADETPIQLDPPLRTTLRVHQRSTPLRGEITAWTYGAFWVLRDGGLTPVRTGWDVLEAGKVFELMRRIIDRDDADGRLRLGIELLRLNEPGLARRAFQTAERADPGLAETIERAIEAHRTGGDPALALVRSDPMATAAAAPGPETTNQRPGQIADPSTRASSRTERMELPFERFETEHFLVLVQEGGILAENLAIILERIYTEFASALGLGEGGSFFKNKCVCYLFTDSADFRRLAGQFRGGDDPDSNMNDRSYFIRTEERGLVELGFMQSDEIASTWEFQMFRDAAHAILDHHGSDRRLPLWVETGLIRHVELNIKPDGVSERKQVEWAAEYSRHNSVAVFIRRSVDKFDSFSADSVVVSHFLVRSLLVQKPVEFTDWVRRIKAGEDWEPAMKNSMAFDADALGRWFEAQLGVEQP
jgi:hypothetical protein